MARMCEGQHYQAFVERVADDAKAGFFIEAGRLREPEKSDGRNRG